MSKTMPTSAGHEAGVAPAVDRIAVIARLEPGTGPAAKALIGAGPPYELADAFFTRHAVYLADDEVVFVFEGVGVEQHVRDLVNDPSRSAAFSAWGPLLAGPPRLAFAQFWWTSPSPAAQPVHQTPKGARNA